jgi:hypothetical protein
MRHDDATVIPFARSRARGPLPRWATRFFTIMAAGTIAWMVWLGWSLPARATMHDYNTAWIGFDALIVLSSIGAAVLGLRRSALVQFPLFATAVLLVVDAWFDVTTSSGMSGTVAIVMAVAAEIPLAFLFAWLAVRAARWHAPARGASLAEVRALPVDVAARS